ncbi:MAG: NAD(P)/FAD-dependent oxidoreductase [Candidatus Micrarchaeota archaeon]
MAASKSSEFDAIIVGAGPGGASMAMYLQKQGQNVLLLEKSEFPRDKICGDAIGVRAMVVLRELGIADQMEAQKHEKTYGVIFSSPKGQTVQIQFPNTDPSTGKGGYVCRRMVFDNFLFQNAKKRVLNVRENIQVTDLIWENDFVVGVKAIDLKTKQHLEFKSKIVIGADGASGIVAAKLGLNASLPEHECIALRQYYENIGGCTNNIEIHFVDSLLPGYFWIFPLENNTANVGVGMLASDIKKKKVKLQESMDAVIKNDPLFKERFAKAKAISDIKGWRLPLGSFHRKCHGNGWILLGDAASLIDPFSGEGIGNSMTSSRIADKILAKAFEKNDFSENFLRQYDTELWKELGPELKTSSYLQKLGKIKPLLNFVINKASKNKRVQKEISGMLANENAKKEMANPLFYLKLLFA